MNTTKLVPCPYCNDVRTGLPGNACENCMNTGLAHEVSWDDKSAAVALAHEIGMSAEEFTDAADAMAEAFERCRVGATEALLADMCSPPSTEMLSAGVDAYRKHVNAGAVWQAMLAAYRLSMTNSIEAPGEREAVVRFINSQPCCQEHGEVGCHPPRCDICPRHLADAISRGDHIGEQGEG